MNLLVPLPDTITHLRPSIQNARTYILDQNPIHTTPLLSVCSVFILVYSISNISQKDPKKEKKNNKNKKQIMLRG